MTPSRTRLQILIGVGWRGSTCSKKKTCYDFNTPLDCELYFGDMQVTGQPLGFESGLKESATKKMDFLLFLCIFEVLVAQSCPTLCDPMDCRLFCPWNSPKNTRMDCHSLLQGIILTRDRTLVSYTAGRFFTPEPPGKPLVSLCAFHSQKD